jgi:hypothetical protein
MTSASATPTGKLATRKVPAWADCSAVLRFKLRSAHKHPIHPQEETPIMAIINGNNRRNVLRGTEQDDLIKGLGGNDIINGKGGFDQLYGGIGDDQVYGGTGHDQMFGEAGNDQMFGEAGDDRIRGGAGNDRVDGGIGNDQMWGDAGNDLMYGGVGNDRILGGAGNDQMWGGAGDDIINGGAGNDIVRSYGGGQPEFDRLTGGAGADVFVMTDGSDNQAYLNDDLLNTTNSKGFALITDFQGSLDSKQDSVVLDGFSQHYRLTSVSWGQEFGRADTNAFSDVALIYVGSEGDKQDVVAVFQDVSNQFINNSSGYLNNPNVFTFLG